MSATYEVVRSLSPRKGLFRISSSLSCMKPLKFKTYTMQEDWKKLMLNIYIGAFKIIDSANDYLWSYAWLLFSQRSKDMGNLYEQRNNEELMDRAVKLFKECYNEAYNLRKEENYYIIEKDTQRYVTFQKNGKVMLTILSDDAKPIFGTHAYWFVNTSSPNWKEKYEIRRF